MTYDVYLMRVSHRTGLEDAVLVQQLVHRVMEHLGHCFSVEQADDFAESLPQPLSTIFVQAAAERPCDLDALYRTIAEDFSVDLSFAVEFTQVVLQVFGETVGRTGRGRLRRVLPEEWHPLFEPRRLPEPVVHHHRGRRTLAEGRPGSRRSLAEASPPASRPLPE